MAFRLRLFVAALGVAALPLIPASAQTDKPDPVIARVNGAEIHMSDAIAFHQNLPRQFREMPFSTVFPAVVERLIDLKLVAEAARADNLADDPEVKRRIAQVQEAVLREVYLARAVAARIDDATLRQRYDAMVAAMPRKEEVKARHILVKTEAEAKAIIAEIAGGADFATVAKERSKGPSASGGGDLGYFTKDSMVPAFADAAFALQPGEVSPKPVKTQFGWHVIEVEDRRQTPPPTFEEMRGKLTDELTGDLVGTVMKDLRKGAEIVRYDASGKPVEGAASQ